MYKAIDKYTKIVYNNKCKEEVSSPLGKEETLVSKKKAKQKKKRGSKPDSYINLTAAILNLITATLLLIEKLSQ